MRKSSLVIVIMLSAWLLMVGCNADEGLQQESKPVVVDLALTVSNAPQLTTRMTGTNVQAAGNYRGIEMTRIVPFNTHGKITVDDTPTWYQISALRTDYLRTDHFWTCSERFIDQGSQRFHHRDIPSGDGSAAYPFLFGTYLSTCRTLYCHIVG